LHLDLKILKHSCNIIVITNIYKIYFHNSFFRMNIKTIYACTNIYICKVDVYILEHHN
jgi:hypothetical protein